MVRTETANGSTPGEQPRHRRTRRDFLASRRDLLDAAERLLVEQGGRFSLIDIAAEAGVSTATAYRHFADVAAVLDAYYARLIESLVAHIAELSPGPHALSHFTAACDLWVRDAMTWGRAAVQVRSSRGFLERLRAGDPLIGRLYDALAGLVARLSDEGFTPPSAAEYAVLLWVTVFDERVIIDLHDNLGWPVKKIVDELTGSVLRALGHRSEADPSRAPGGRLDLDE